jgi:ubiquinone/menaquinone biosynthesis C-methylase UbiE
MSSAQSQPVTPERIRQFSFGFAPTLLIEAGVRHRIFDVLDTGPRTVEEVSTETGASRRGLRAVMNALVGLNFLAKDSQGRYTLTPESEMFLVSSKPSFQGGLFRHVSRQLAPNWLHLHDIVRTGQPAVAVNAEAEGGTFFQDFVEDLYPMNYPAAQALGQALDLQSRPAASVLDLAAGSGVWGITLAQQAPNVEVTAVDWPAVIPVTRRTAERMGVAGRFHFVAGDLLTADFGTGHDVATLGHILHSEGPARSQALLNKTFAALVPGGTIAIAEFLVNEDRTGPPMSLIFAVNMLVNTEHGDTYSFKEIAGWLADAGFQQVKTLDVPGPSPLILATKPA